MNFFITTNEDGTIATCEPVEGKKRGMFYVRANSKEEACEIFAAKWLRHRANRTRGQAAMLRRRKEQGLCVDCGKNEAREGKTACQSCADADSARRKELMAGAPRRNKPRVVHRAQDYLQILERQRRHRLGKTDHYKRTGRINLLKAVLVQYRKSSAARFEGWLIARIAKESESSEVCARRAQEKATPCPS